MIDIDTNVLIRYIIQDDPLQSALATEFLEKNCTPENPGYLHAIVLCELVWVLESSYEYKREQVAMVLQYLLETDSLVIQEIENVGLALEAYREKSIDFSDALLGESNQSHGCQTTITLEKSH
ncbi:MAG: type II toxin-antitoxin system VapC family toxin [Pseudomonadota bacterium]|nr:type II toxin-antitoxin system VapC family toxin [Pseudomonadota bacterium]